MKKVSVNGIPIHLTGKEYKMLELLVPRKGVTVTKEMFLNYLYGGMDEPDAKIVDASCANCGRSSDGLRWGRVYRGDLLSRIRVAR